MSKPKSLFALLIILNLQIVSGGISAQQAWTRLTPLPQDNNINDMIKIPGTDRLVAVVDNSTIMFSEDQGDSWEVIINQNELYLYDYSGQLFNQIKFNPRQKSFNLNGWYLFPGLYYLILKTERHNSIAGKIIKL